MILSVEVLAMSPGHGTSPLFDGHLQLYQRLVQGDPTATSDLACTFLEPLIHWLTEQNPGIHPDLINEAAEDALLALFHNPSSYHSQEKSLEGYLRMSARGDLLNILRRETTHRSRHISLEAVELSAGVGKDTGRMDDPAFSLLVQEALVSQNQDLLASMPAGLTEVETRVLELMQRGERHTAVYAEAAGLADRPLQEQRQGVKRIKDRLKKRIQRQGGS
jgi:DNA-directed RNA polymerase specialized sigma24 family protein